MLWNGALGVIEQQSLISDFKHLCMFEKMMITSVDPDDLLFPVHCK